MRHAIISPHPLPRSRTNSLIYFWSLTAALESQRLQIVELDESWRFAEVFRKNSAIVAMPFDKPLKSPPIFPCGPSRLRYIPPALEEDLFQVLCLESFNHPLLGIPKWQDGPPIFLIIQFNILWPYDIATHNSRSTYDGLKLSDIAGPVVRHQFHHGRMANGLPMLLKETMGKQRNIALPIPEGRKMCRKNVESVIQILPKPLRLDFL